KTHMGMSRTRFVIQQSTKFLRQSASVPEFPLLALPAQTGDAPTSCLELNLCDSRTQYAGPHGYRELSKANMRPDHPDGCFPTQWQLRENATGDLQLVRRPRHQAPDIPGERRATVLTDSPS